MVSVANENASAAGLKSNLHGRDGISLFWRVIDQVVLLENWMVRGVVSIVSE